MFTRRCESWCRDLNRQGRPVEVLSATLVREHAINSFYVCTGPEEPDEYCIRACTFAGEGLAAILSKARSTEEAI